MFDNLFWQKPEGTTVFNLELCWKSKTGSLNGPEIKIKPSTSN